MRDFDISRLYKIKSIKACLSVCLPAKMVLTVITGSFVFAIGGSFQIHQKYDSKFEYWIGKGMYHPLTDTGLETLDLQGIFTS